MDKFFRRFLRPQHPEPSPPTPPIPLAVFLAGVKSGHVTPTTCKSTVASLYHLPQGVDVVISFAVQQERKVRMSPGLARHLKAKRGLNLADWGKLPVIELQSLMDNFEMKTIPQVGKPPIIILTVTSDLLPPLQCALSLLSSHSLKQGPLRVGIDHYTLPGLCDAGAVDILHLIHSCPELCFMFYNHRGRPLSFADIHVPYSSTATSLAHTGPTFLPGLTSLECYINSMAELRHVLGSVESEQTRKYQPLLADLTSGDSTTSGYALTEIRAAGLNIFDNSTSKLLLNTPVDTLQWGYCLEAGGKFVSYDESTSRFTTCEPFVLVARQALLLDGAMFRELGSVDLTTVPMPKLTWIAGVPGCGKTTDIVRQHRPGQDLVLCQTRKGIEDVRAAVLGSGYKVSARRLKTDYRTLGSFFLNGSDRSYRRILIDEVLLMHAGYIGFLVRKTGASEVLLFGDDKQIPYLERDGVLKPQWGSITSLLEGPTETRHVTHRCPTDVTYILKSFYPGITTTSRQVRSICHTRFTGQVPQPQIPDTLYLTFTQREKHFVKTLLPSESRVLTVHEAQGATSSDVVLVRLDGVSTRLADQEAYVIVALTRHTRRFTYVSSCKPDLVTNLISQLKGLTRGELLAWHQQRQPDDPVLSLDLPTTTTTHASYPCVAERKVPSVRPPKPVPQRKCLPPDKLSSRAAWTWVYGYRRNLPPRLLRLIPVGGPVPHILQ